MEKYLRDASCFSIIHDGQGLLNLDDQVGIFWILVGAYNFQKKRLSSRHERQYCVPPAVDDRSSQRDS